MAAQSNTTPTPSKPTMTVLVLTGQKTTRKKCRPKRKTPSSPTSLPLPIPQVRQCQSRQKHQSSSKGGHDACPTFYPNSKDSLHLAHCCGLSTVCYHRVCWRSDCSPSPHTKNEVFRGTSRGGFNYLLWRPQPTLSNTRALSRGHGATPVCCAI